MASNDALLSAIENSLLLAGVEEICPAELFHANPKKVEYIDHAAMCATEPFTCLSRCESGSANHCFGLAFSLQTAHTPKIYAAQLYAQGCKLGSVTSCTNRAAGLMRFNEERAVCFAETFRLTCGELDAWGCTMYGWTLSKGMGIERDPEQALKVLKTGCQHGMEDEACRYAMAIERDILKAHIVGE